MKADYLTEKDLNYLRELRQRGFAICIWTPYEVDLLDENMSVEDLEDAMCEYASQFIGNESDGE